jgi:hypothetical protein
MAHKPARSSSDVFLVRNLFILTATTIYVQ